MGRVIGDIREREGRVPVGPEGAVALVAHPPVPAQHPDGEVEQARGQRPVIRISKNAMTVTTAKASHRKSSTTRCGISSSHLPSPNHRDSEDTGTASTRTGYGGGFSVVV